MGETDVSLHQRSNIFKGSTVNIRKKGNGSEFEKPPEGEDCPAEDRYSKAIKPLGNWKEEKLYSLQTSKSRSD